VRPQIMAALAERLAMVGAAARLNAKSLKIAMT
jgi:hypothetical protein